MWRGRGCRSRLNTDIQARKIAERIGWRCHEGAYPFIRAAHSLLRHCRHSLLPSRSAGEPRPLRQARSAILEISALARVLTSCVDAPSLVSAQSLMEQIRNFRRTDKHHAPPRRDGSKAGPSVEGRQDLTTSRLMRRELSSGRSAASGGGKEVAGAGGLRAPVKEHSLSSISGLKHGALLLFCVQERFRVARERYSHAARSAMQIRIPHDNRCLSCVALPL